MSLAEPIFVTGANGFIGRHLVARLVDEGRRVRALVLPDETVPDGWEGRVEVRRGDISNAESVEHTMAGAASVFHLAAVVNDWGSDELHRLVTVEGTRHVLGGAARRSMRAILASSIVVYGHHLQDAVCVEDQEWGEAFGPYSRSKQAQEKIAWELAEKEGLKLSVVRPANVFGPGSKLWVEELAELLQRKMPTVIGRGEGGAGLCYVHNLVDILIRAATTEKAIRRVYNAADGSDVTWKGYVTDLAAQAGAPPPRSVHAGLAWKLAPWLERAWRLVRARNRPPLTREALNLAGSDLRIPVDRARDELGFTPVASYDEAMTAVGAALKLLADRIDAVRSISPRGVGTTNPS